MDDFKWTVFLNALHDRTLNPTTLASTLNGAVLTKTQLYTVMLLLEDLKGTIYGIHISKEIWKLNKR